MTEEAALPEFATAMRGYDRLQVDDFIVKQAVWLSEAEGRVAAAEDELSSVRAERASLRAQVASLEEQAFKAAPPSFAELGERVARVLQEAWSAAEEMRQDAETATAESTARAEARLARADEEAERRTRSAASEVETVVSRAREEAVAEAADVIESARQESAELLARCRDEADRLTGEAERRRRELRAEIAILTDQRAAAMAELGRVRSGLEALFSVATETRLEEPGMEETRAGDGGPPTVGAAEIPGDEAIDLREEDAAAAAVGAVEDAVGAQRG